jgi:OHCU decarboxylase
MVSQEEFIERYGDVYENSPWVAQGCWPKGADTDSVEALAGLMARVVDRAGRTRQLALIRAHPDLAGRLAVSGELTQSSTSEQSSAGLDQCSAEEFSQFQALNEAYTKKFSFPFVMAVRDSNRQEILAAFRKRLENNYAQEFEKAISEIHKIARLRLEQLF